MQTITKQSTRAAGGLALALAVPLAVAALDGLAPTPASFPALACLLAVVAAASVGGRRSGAFAAGAGFLVLVFLLARRGPSLHDAVEGLSTLALFTLAAATAVTLLARWEVLRERLVQSRQSYRALVEELPLVTYAQRVDESRVVYVSPQVEGLLEITVEQALAEQDFWLA